MKFKELNNKDKFTLESQPGLIFTKVKYKRASCCEEEHNAIYRTTDNKRQKVVIGDDIDVVLVSESVSIENSESPTSETMKVIQKKYNAKKAKYYEKSQAKKKNRGGGSFGK